MNCADFSRLQEGAGPRVKFLPVSGLVEQLRAVKDEEEVARIRGAGRITVEVFEKVLGKVKPGVSESELAAEIEYQMRLQGRGGCGVRDDRGLRPARCAASRPSLPQVTEGK